MLDTCVTVWSQETQLTLIGFGLRGAGGGCNKNGTEGQYRVVWKNKRS